MARVAQAHSRLEPLELHRRIASVVETSWSLGDIDRAVKEMSTPQYPILAGAMEAQMPRGDYWAGLYKVHAARATAGRARLSAHGRARRLVNM